MQPIRREINKAKIHEFKFSYPGIGNWPKDHYEIQIQVGLYDGNDVLVEEKHYTLGSEVAFDEAKLKLYIEKLKTIGVDFEKLGAERYELEVQRKIQSLKERH